MARLAGTIHRYVGNSREIKPYVGMVDATGIAIAVGDLPVGSVFDEEDTGDRYSYTGERWERDSATALIRNVQATLEARLGPLLDEARAQTILLRELTQNISEEEGAET